MAYEYIGAIAYLLWFLFVFLYYNNSSPRGGLKNRRTASMVLPKENCASKSTTDIIIVGAGVAGAALAYSLAKVRIPSTVFPSSYNVFLEFP